MDHGERRPGWMGRMTSFLQMRFLVSFAIILAGVGLLVARGAKNSMVYYVTVTELVAKDRTESLHGLRVAGTVVPGSIERADLELRFQMTDGAQAIPVHYQGVIPDTFGEKGEVVVEGDFGTAGTFEANFLMAKCPSKYEMSPDDAAGSAPPSGQNPEPYSGGI